MATADGVLHGSGEPSKQISGLVGSWESELAPVQHSLKFVKKLEAQYVCPVCQGVVLNPHQSSCGHIFCYHCIQGLMSLSDSPFCPTDSVVINPKEEHLKKCPFELSHRCNAGRVEEGQQTDFTDHLKNTCLEPCRHCQQLYIWTQMKHDKNACPEVEVDCPNSCFHLVKSLKLNSHTNLCPEVQIDCVYKKYGCSVQGKRAEVKIHEDTGLNQHILLVLGSNKELVKQIEVLQQELLLRQKQIMEENIVLSGLKEEVKPLAQLTGRCDQTLSVLQTTLDEQRGHISSVKLQLQKLSNVFGPSKAREEVSQLRASLEMLRHQVSAAEGLKDHLGALKENLKDHAHILDIHTAQLSRNETRFHDLESTSFDGRLIWKIQDFHKWKKAEANDHQPCLTSAPFHTGRCGYKVAAKAYLNGDGEGRETHLSLYIVLMQGDFDPLLPWPFRQTVSLSVLDQSGASNHLTLSFRPDPTCNSFQRPGVDSTTNIATGFSRFISHVQLEHPKNAVYVKDDTLFIKVKVDMTGLEDL